MTFVATRRVGVGPEVKMDSQRLGRKSAMFVCLVLVRSGVAVARELGGEERAFEGWRCVCYVFLVVEVVVAVVIRRWKLAGRGWCR